MGDHTAHCYTYADWLSERLAALPHALREIVLPVADWLLLRELANGVEEVWTAFPDIRGHDQTNWEALRASMAMHQEVVIVHPRPPSVQ